MLTVSILVRWCTTQDKKHNYYPKYQKKDEGSTRNSKKHNHYPKYQKKDQRSTRMSIVHISILLLFQISPCQQNQIK